MSDDLTSAVTFGPFRLDVANETLERHGRRLRLVGQPLQLLLLLVARAGQLVSREELCDALWGRDTFVDFEQGLNTAVNKLRHALGDSAERPLYIETVPGRGYRFVAPIAVEPDRAGDDPSKRPPVASRPLRLPRAWLLVGGVLALVALVALPYVGYELASRKARAPAAVTQFEVVPPVGYWLEPAFTRQGFDIAPDGSRLLFTARGVDGQLHTWRRDLDDVTLHPIPAADSAQTVFWGPESRRIFFARGDSLRVGDLTGEPYRVLSERTEVLHGVVLSTEQLLVTGNRQTSVLVPLDGGESERLPAALPWAEPLPDGEHVVYLAFGENPYDNIARVTTVAAGHGGGVDVVETRSRVEYAPSAGDPRVGHLLYVRSGTLLAQPFDTRALRVTGEATPLASGVHHFATAGAADFAVSETGVLVYQPFQGRTQLAWVDRSGRVEDLVGPPDQGVYHVAVSPDERRIAAELYSVEDGHTRLWVFDRETGDGRPIASELMGGAVWAPDSTRLVFSGVALGRLPVLYVRDVTEEGYGEPLLPEGRADQLQIPTDWSADGRFVVYESRLEGDLWIVDQALETTSPLLRLPARETAGALSPDGRRLAFLSDETGRLELYIQSFDPGRTPHLHGERRKLSSVGALFLRWSRGGREILFAGADGKLYAVALTDTGAAAGAPTALLDVEMEATTPMITQFSFDVSRDGERLLVPRLTNPRRDHLVVVQNWPALLESAR